MAQRRSRSSYRDITSCPYTRWSGMNVQLQALVEEQSAWLSATAGHPYHLDPYVSLMAYNRVRGEVCRTQNVSPDLHLFTPSPGAPIFLHGSGKPLGSIVMDMDSRGRIGQGLTKPQPRRVRGEVSRTQNVSPDFHLFTPSPGAPSFFTAVANVWAP